MKPDLTGKTLDELHELQQWIVDRLRYCIACNIPAPAEDSTLEHYIEWEIYRRETA